MKAVITIRMDSAAFQVAPGSQLCRILRLLARRIETEAPIEAVLRDSDGREVGLFCLDSDWRQS